MRSALPLVLALALLPTPAHADALLDRVVAAALATPAAAFTRTVTAEQRGGKKGEPPRVTVERFDPARPEAERWTLATIDGRAPTPDEQRRFRDGRKGEPVPGYYRVATLLANGATRVAGPDGRAVYRVAQMPKGSVKSGGRDLSAHVSAEVVVDPDPRGPFVEELRLISAKPFRMMLIARVDRFEAVSRYAPRPGGAPAIVSQSSEIAGSVAGSSGTLLVNSLYRAH